MSTEPSQPPAPPSEPSPVAPPGPAAPPQPAQPQPPAPKEGRNWARLGCFGCFGLAVVLSCCAVAGVFGGPALWNQLFRSRAEELYSGAPDPFASRVVSQILLDAGIAGARAIVIPIQESQGQIAVVTLDEGDGFAGMGTASANEMTMMSVIQRMREDNRMEDLGIERVTVDYRDENGQCLVAITASQSSLDAFAEGEISREQFMREVAIGPGSLSFQEVLDLLQETG